MRELGLMALTEGVARGQSRGQIADRASENFVDSWLHVGAGPLLSIAALGVLGTGVAYVLNYAVVRRAGATIASTVTYVIPLFATACGVLLLDEGLDWNEPVGALVVVLGVTISHGRLGVRSRNPPTLRARHAEVA